VECVGALQDIDTDRINVYTHLMARTGRTPVAHELCFISVAARRLGLHPQTLRKYERLGLIRPSRAIGSMRVYSARELERLRLIKHLVDELGVNLAGVQRLLSIAEVLERLLPLARDGALSRHGQRRRLERELERLGEIIGL
jgi:MerR family transcriptional regulator, heat shock protein HspR